jgi:hypothetical protein
LGHLEAHIRFWPISDIGERLQSTRCSRSVFYKADVQRIELPGDRGNQRESREQPGSLDY